MITIAKKIITITSLIFFTSISNPAFAEDDWVELDDSPVVSQKEVEPKSTKIIKKRENGTSSYKQVDSNDTNHKNDGWEDVDDIDIPKAQKPTPKKSPKNNTVNNSVSKAQPDEIEVEVTPTINNSKKRNNNTKPNNLDLSLTSEDKDLLDYDEIEQEDQKYDSLEDIVARNDGQNEKELEEYAKLAKNSKPVLVEYPIQINKNEKQKVTDLKQEKKLNPLDWYKLNIFGKIVMSVFIAFSLIKLISVLYKYYNTVENTPQTNTKVVNLPLSNNTNKKAHTRRKNKRKRK